MTRKLVEVHELNEQRANQQAFEVALFRAAKVRTRKLKNGDQMHEVVACVVDSNKGKQEIGATIIASKNIQSLPLEVQQQLLTYYQSEFVRPGSPMQHPDTGHVILFSINNKPTGFFYLGENEKVENGLIPSVLKHIQTGLLRFEEFPSDLQDMLAVYFRISVPKVHLSDVGTEVARPMRFYIYPEAQGNGGLKILLALTKLATAILNQDKEWMYQIVEARAGLMPGRIGNKSAFSGHQLVPAYVAKGMDLTVHGKRSEEVRDNLLVWHNIPYNNFSLSYFVAVAEILRLITKD